MKPNNCSSEGRLGDHSRQTGDDGGEGTKPGAVKVESTGLGLPTVRERRSRSDRDRCPSPRLCDTGMVRMWQVRINV